MLEDRLITCAIWGYRADTNDMTIIAKGYLDRQGVKETRFKENMPGNEWAESFLYRNKDKLTERICQNTKRSAAKISREAVAELSQYGAESRRCSAKKHRQLRQNE